MANEAEMLASTVNHQQWVCTVCGYNMIGEMPDVCPFCRARHDKFLTWDEAEQTYRVTPHEINNYVTQLISVPRLGIEHAAYRIETDSGAVWIDCPSAFNRDLEPVEAIYFTHRDFMGASNQYRDLSKREFVRVAWPKAREKEYPILLKVGMNFSLNQAKSQSSLGTLSIQKGLIPNEQPAFLILANQFQWP
ncbi:rubrerythrin family protein [Moorena producens]|uniref:rubrerythrin family protein n=1 Tax=Moorena producens TaxID=1155739 RepID=UPI000ADE48E1|nr:rubrerythrin family protein [Moorena producens]